MKLEVRLQFRRIAKSLAAQAEVAAGTGHPVTTGRLREAIIQKFLRPHLPKTFDIRSGVILDSNGNKSRQQDCIIVDTRLPTVDVGSDTDAILIAESVVATIEIKSFLNSGELLSSLESMEITKRLLRKGEQLYRKGPVEIQIPEPLPILTYLFAYDSMSLKKLMVGIFEFAKERSDTSFTPEAVCVLNKGVLLRTSFVPLVRGNNVTLPPLKECKLTAQPLEKDALFAFYRRLLDDVVPLRMINYDIDGYYSASGIE
jgi:hypothetical protein